jgi:hypothetical protein
MADGEQERSLWGPPQPLASLGRAALRVDGTGLRFGSLVIPKADLRTVSTERADTLQVATAEGMWHFRPDGASVFRLQWMLEAVMPPRRPVAGRLPSRALAARLGVIAPGAGRR